MNTGINYPALAVLIGLFLLVTVMGFWASNWRRGEHLASLDEWGLGGRTFGTWITWFLLGGDLYTAYTFVAVPAAMFALGSVSGFFAVPYTIILYPIIFIYMSRLWSVSYRHGYVTAADFVRGRYGSKELSLAVAITGILATMPYIALQLVGIQAVLEVVGLGGSGSVIAKDLPLFIAFALLAAYTYSAGLRAPAVIAFVKDGLIYLVILVAIIYLPSKVGGWAHVFEAAQAKMTSLNAARQTGGRVHSAAASLLGICDAGAGLRPGAVHVPAFDHGDAFLAEPQYDSPQCDDPACLQFRARAVGAARMGGDRRGHEADRVGRRAQRAAGDSAAVRRLLSGLVCRSGLCGCCHRRAGAGGHHVDRRGQYLHAKHLPGVDKAERHACRGSQRFQDRLAGREGLCAGVRADVGQAERHQFPTARRHLDPPDVPRRSSSACIRDGSTAGGCSPVGLAACCTGRSRRTT